MLLHKIPKHFEAYLENLLRLCKFPNKMSSKVISLSRIVKCYTGELGYDRPLYDRFLHMTDDRLGPSLMHIKYSSYVYDGFCI